MSFFSASTLFNRTIRRGSDERLRACSQPTQIALGTTQGTTNLLDLDYTYGTTANNGKVMSQTITVPTVGANTGFTAVQSYSYDPLNRLKDATENITLHGGSQTQSWKQTFLFDRYGNRNFDEANTTFAGFDKLWRFYSGWSGTAARSVEEHDGPLPGRTSNLLYK